MQARRMTTSIATIAASAALVCGAALPAAAADLPDSVDSTSASSCDFGERVVRIFLRLPAELRDDVRDVARMSPGEERREEAREVRRGILTGEYGKRVQALAVHGAQVRLRLLAQMPEELRADLGEVRAAEPGEERRALVSDIADQALDGIYGERVQKIALRVQDNLQDCVESNG